MKDRISIRPRFALLLGLMISLMGSGCRANQESKTTMSRLTKIALPQEFVSDEEGLEKGVSGAFAGVLGEWLIYGGGCNFPDKGPLEGGQKRFYSRIHALRISGEGEVLDTLTLGALERPSGYGASLRSEEGDTLYFIGGTDGTASLRSICRITLNKKGVPTLERQTDALSHGWYEGSAAIVGRRLCLVGGWAAPGRPMREVEAMDLHEGGELRPIAPLPDGVRIQPIAFAHSGKLFVCGGFAPSEGGRAPLMQDRSYALRLGDETAEWQLVSDHPVLEEGGRKLLFVGTAVAYDEVAERIYAVGGVDYDIFRSALEREYRQGLATASGDRAALEDFARQRIEYMTRDPEAYCFMPHTINLDYESGEWSVVATDTAFATAGSALAAQGGTLYLVGGERKPGVRTPDIWQLCLD